MSRKTASLSDLTLSKHTPASAQASTAPLPSRQEVRTKPKRRGQTLRLEEGAWKQLKHLAVDKSTCCHDLLLEAVNDLFQKYGKAPIA